MPLDVLGAKRPFQEESSLSTGYVFGQNPLQLHELVDGLVQCSWGLILSLLKYSDNPQQFVLHTVGFEKMGPHVCNIFWGKQVIESAAHVGPSSNIGPQKAFWVFSP